MALNMLITVSSLFIAAIFPFVSSLTEECSRVRTACTTAHIKDQQNNVEACFAGQNFFRCLETALNNAQQRGTCDKLALYTFRHDAFLEAGPYARNCPNFVIPSSFEQPSCEQQMAGCGSFIFRAFVANNTNDNKMKCSELEGFTQCMGTNTRSCAPLSIQAFVQTEIINFQYEQTCVPSMSAECSTVRAACDRKHTEEQQQNYPECQTNLFNCLAASFTNAEQRGICGEIALNKYRYDAYRNVLAYDQNCPGGFPIPSSLQLDQCQIDMANCGSYAFNVFVANSNNDDVAKCRELTEFMNCMESSTPSCTDRQNINSIVQKDLLVYEYQDTCIDTTTTTTTTQKPTTPKPATQKPATQKPATNKPGGNGGQPIVIGGGGSGNRVYPFTLATLGLTFIVCLLRV